MGERYRPYLDSLAIIAVVDLLMLLAVGLVGWFLGWDTLYQYATPRSWGECSWLLLGPLHSCKTEIGQDGPPTGRSRRGWD